MIAQATRRWDNRYELRFPFNKLLVEKLKLHIPACYREYEPASKTWVIDAVYASTAIQLLRSVFPDARISEHQDADPPSPNLFQQSTPHKVLYVLPDAPKCVIEAAYRALSREAHPDRAPADQRDQAHEAMVALNEAYSVLRDRVIS